MSKVGQIGENVTEDVVDEFASSVTYHYANQTFKPLKEYLNKNISNEFVKEALESGVNTLQFSVMNAVIISVQQMFLAKIITTSSLIYGYIKAGRVVKSLQKFKNSKIKRVGKVFGSVFKRATSVILGNQDERLALANIANNNVNNLTNIISNERQNQILMRDSRVKHFDNMLNNTQKSNFSNIEKDINLFKLKTSKALWKNTIEDKRLYQRATGFKFSNSQDVWNNNFVEELNKFSDVVKTADGKIINESEAFLQYVTTSGHQRFK